MLQNIAERAFSANISICTESITIRKQKHDAPDSSGFIISICSAITRQQILYSTSPQCTGLCDPRTSHIVFFVSNSAARAVGKQAVALLAPMQFYYTLLASVCCLWFFSANKGKTKKQVIKAYFQNVGLINSQDSAKYSSSGNCLKFEHPHVRFFLQKKCCLSRGPAALLFPKCTLYS